MIDNHHLVMPFVPERDDGDTFIYTEIVDRSSGKGNNSNRIIKTFYHRSRDEFASQLDAMRFLCEATGSRAYTRLAPRSYQKVGRLFTRIVVESAMLGTFASMEHLYKRACGVVTPLHKLWLYDVDEISPRVDGLAAALSGLGFLRAIVPSRKGVHLITVPHRMGLFNEAGVSFVVHKDNPTNLYIPDSAA